MRVEAVLERLGGVASAGELRRHVSWPRIRLAARKGRIVRDGRGRYSLPGADEDRRAANRLSGVLCLQSAARQHGWRLKQQPDEPVVAVPRNRKLGPERRSGARILYVDLPAEHVAGIVTSPAYTVIQCAARLPFDEALAIADSACRAGDVTASRLAAVAAAMPLRYRGRCLRVAREADGRADNPFESVARAIALDVPGLRVRPQVWIGSVGRADPGDRMLRLAVECESFEFHGVRRLLKRDCERYNAFVVRGWLVVRFCHEQSARTPATLPREPPVEPGRVHVVVARRVADWRPTRGVRHAMADKKLSKGDQVEWNSHGSTAEGSVEKEITGDTEAAGRKVKASEDDPQYLVKSDKSGGEAVHKPDALRKKGSK